MKLFRSISSVVQSREFWKMVMEILVVAAVAAAYIYGNSSPHLLQIIEDTYGARQ